MKRGHATIAALAAVAKKIGGVLRRILDAAEEARYRAAQREIRRIIGQSDGHLCDETARRIDQYLTRNSSF
jgi:hypothetical protein